MTISIDATEKEVIKRVKTFISNIQNRETNMDNKVIALSKISETEDHINYKVTGYELMPQYEDKLWTGSNKVICKVVTDNNTGEHHFLSLEDNDVLTKEEVVKAICDIIL